MTPEDLNRVLETERTNLHQLIPKEPWFIVFMRDKFTRLWIIYDHIDETRVAIELCSMCDWGCKECLVIKN